jgi:signal transduction histidine kinase
MTPVDLRALVGEIARDAEFEAGAAGRRVRLEVEEDAVVSGSAPALRSAIENVLRNAVRHTPKGTEVIVALRRHEMQATIEVRDQGPGVPESELPELFRPFRRGPEGGAAGLGLAIADRALRAHGGTIEARRVPSGGLGIVMRLPLLRPAPNRTLHSPA